MTINDFDFVVTDDDDPYMSASDPTMQEPEENQGPMPQANTPRPRYRILSAGDYLQPQPPVEYVVEKFISAGSVNVFYGEGGSGKTYVAVDLCVCVARGDDWIGFKTTQGPVLIIDEENGERRISRRLGEAMRGHSADKQTPIYSISYAGFDFGNKKDLEELRSLILVSGARLVVIDALSDIMPGRDENAMKDLKHIFLALRRIAEETQTAILIIHHANRGNGKDNYRGSSTIKNDVDLMVKVESEPGKNLINFEVTKARDEAPIKFSAISNFMTLDPKEFWLTASAKIPQSKRSFTTAQEYVLKYLLKHGKSQIDDIEGHADVCAPETARKAVYALAKISLAERVDGGGRGVIAEYQLTPDGHSEAAKL